jgi:hypothetical protein
LICAIARCPTEYEIAQDQPLLNLTAEQRFDRFDRRLMGSR